ncbi:MAG: NfeD family protein [Calditrichaeota bacterium]|nr:NfeD family protein [Calditrichota bacterium]
MENLPDWLKPELVWFIIGLILLLVEFGAPGLIIGFFGIGAWVVSGMLLFTDISLSTQLITFIIVSVLLTIFLRKWIQKVFKLESIQNQTDEKSEFVGQKALVTKTIKPNEPGKVEFRGTHWEAEADVEITEGSRVEITDRKSITFVVKPV